jgi:hypothetical protein
MTGSVHNGVADLPSYHADYQGKSSSRDSGIGRIMDQIIGDDALYGHSGSRRFRSEESTPFSDLERYSTPPVDPGDQTG